MEVGLSHSSSSSATGSPEVPARLLESVAFFPAACGLVMCAASFWNMVDINFEGNSGDQLGMDWQVAIKLVIAVFAGAIGFWGLINSNLVRTALRGVPGIGLVMLAVVFVTTSVFAIAEVAMVCRVAAWIYIAYLLFIPTALVAMGIRGVVIASLIGMTANVILNWGVYLWIPSVGVFEEQFAGNTFIQRMGGLGHPNSIGRMGALAGLLSLAMLRSRALAPRLPGGTLVLLSIIALSIATSVATFSRTAIVAGLAAAIFLLFDRLATRGGVTAIVAGILTIGIGLFTIELVTGGEVIGKFLLSAGTKTGEVEELTSATGRTDIWKETVRLIGQRPITGYGLNSAPVLLQDYSHHPHNLLLHVTLSGGLLAGLLVAALLLWNIGIGLTSAEPLVRAVSMYVLISGVFEDTCLDTFATPSTLLWLVVLLYPAISAGIRPQRSAIENQAAPRYNGTDRLRPKEGV